MRPLVLSMCLLATASAAQDLAEAPPGALSCSGCHGAGSAIALDGLAAEDIRAATLAFRDGAREGTIMARLAAGFSDDEIAAIAAWLASAETAG